MLALATVPHETIWGGEKLLPYTEGNFKKVGHLYSLCYGRYKGRTFQAYFKENKQKFGLGGYEEFPLIIALVEAKDNLSIQVHPDDVVAVREEGAAYGKNESWFFLEAPSSGNIYNGCRLNDVEEIRQRIENGDCLSVVDTLSVKSGDYVYVEAGTLHALSAGAYLYEIEENSPWTYRFYDFDRIDAFGKKRELHIEKALEALKPDLKSKSMPLGKDAVEERRYTIKKIQGEKSYENRSNTLECVTIIKGECKVDDFRGSTGNTIVLEPGECLMGNLELAIMARPK